MRVESLPDVVRGASKRLELGARRGGLVERRVRLSPRVRGHRDGRCQLAAQAVMSLVRLRRARLELGARLLGARRRAAQVFNLSERLALFAPERPRGFIRGGKARLVPLALGGDGELARARFRGESLARAGGAPPRRLQLGGERARVFVRLGGALPRAALASSAAASFSSVRFLSSARSVPSSARRASASTCERIATAVTSAVAASASAPVLSASAPSAFCKSVPSRGASPSTDAEGASFGFRFSAPATLAARDSAAKALASASSARFSASRARVSAAAASAFASAAAARATRRRA